MSAANMKSRISKTEADVTPPSRVHVVINENGDGEAAIDPYGRTKIAPRDLVVLINRLTALLLGTANIHLRK